MVRHREALSARAPDTIARELRVLADYLYPPIKTF
jgi:hypothetical protein